MLLLSPVLNLDANSTYTGAAINDELRNWISRFGTGLSIDYVTLRRYLIDESLLYRDQFGSSHAMDPAPFFSYDAPLKELDLDELVVPASADRAARNSFAQCFNLRRPNAIDLTFTDATLMMPL
jgi:hypothetical protein